MLISTKIYQMKYSYTISIVFVLSFDFFCHDQRAVLPVGFSADEIQWMQSLSWQETIYPAAGITTPPSSPVRAMAQ
jgi:hypothetical protein